MCVYYLTPYCPSSLTALYLRFVAVTISRIFWSSVNGAHHRLLALRNIGVDPCVCALCQADLKDDFALRLKR